MEASRSTANYTEDDVSATDCVYSTVRIRSLLWLWADSSAWRLPVPEMKKIRRQTASSYFDEGVPERSQKGLHAPGPATGQVDEMIDISRAMDTLDYSARRAIVGVCVAGTVGHDVPDWPTARKLVGPNVQADYERGLIEMRDYLNGWGR